LLSLLPSFNNSFAFFLKKLLKFTKSCKNEKYYRICFLFRCRHAVVIMQILNWTNQCSLFMTVTVTHARDYWWTLDFANVFLSPGVNNRAELVPSPRAYAQNGAVGLGTSIFWKYWLLKFAWPLAPNKCNHACSNVVLIVIYSIQYSVCVKISVYPVVITQIGWCYVTNWPS
jgi:hypothetical protein